MAKAARAKKEELAKPADHTEELSRLRRVRGQIEGVERMIEQGRYCIDIVNQMKSITAALRSTEMVMLERHIRHCMKDAITAGDARLTELKMNELLEIFQKR